MSKAKPRKTKTPAPPARPPGKRPVLTDFYPGVKPRDVYTMADHDWLMEAADQASALAEDDAENGRGEGTCVLGAGLYVYFMQPRNRKPRRLRLVRVSLQGNLAIQRATTGALAYLHARGVAGAFYSDGNMD